MEVHYAVNDAGRNRLEEPIGKEKEEQMAEEQNAAEMQEAAEAQASIDAQSDSLPGEPLPKRKVKRGWIVAGVVAAVIVVAGASILVWP